MKLPNKFVLVGAGALLTLAFAAPAAAAEPEGAIRSAGGPTAVADSYIVVFRDAAVARTRVSANAKSLVDRHGGSVARTYSSALRGFEVRASEKVAARIAADPSVAFVEQNHTVHGDRAPRPTRRRGAWTASTSATCRSTRPTRTRTRPANVHAYIIDTGIRISHNDFGGRATSGFDAVDGGSADDCNGHGTHVAGTVGGSDLRRRQERAARRPSACSTARAAAPPPRSSPASTG